MAIKRAKPEEIKGGGPPCATVQRLGEELLPDLAGGGDDRFAGFEDTV